jgi:hypothetical protein
MRIVPYRSPAFSTIVGAEPSPMKFLPLKQKPTIVKQADLADYINLLDPVRVSFEVDDVKPHLVWMNPAPARKKANDYCKAAYNLDGCSPCEECPGAPGHESDPTIGGPTGAIAAKGRSEAGQYMVIAAEMESRIAARKLTEEQVLTEAALYQSEWQGWKARYDSQREKATGVSYATESDWNELARLDMDLQQLRYKYETLTGLKPKYSLPSADPEDRPGSAIPWNTILTVAGLGIAAYVAVPLINSRKK